MKVKLKSVRTGEIKDVSLNAWSLMQSDGRSRNYTVVSEEKEAPKAESKPKKEKIEIKEIPKFKQEQTDKPKEE
jgi:hypothetical protein